MSAQTVWEYCQQFSIDEFIWKGEEYNAVELMTEGDTEILDAPFNDDDFQECE